MSVESQLVRLANRVAQQTNTADVTHCPDKSPICVGYYQCTDRCPFAKAAHEAFAQKVTNAITSSEYTFGLLTTSTEGSFETLNGSVRYDMRIKSPVDVSPDDEESKAPIK